MRQSFFLTIQYNSIQFANSECVSTWTWRRGRKKRSYTAQEYSTHSTAGARKCSRVCECMCVWQDHKSVCTIQETIQLCVSFRVLWARTLFFHLISKSTIPLGAECPLGECRVLQRRQYENILVCSNSIRWERVNWVSATASRRYSGVYLCHQAPSKPTETTKVGDR